MPEIRREFFVRAPERFPGRNDVENRKFCDGFKEIKGEAVGTPATSVVPGNCESSEAKLFHDSYLVFRHCTF